LGCEAVIDGVYVFVCRLRGVFPPLSMQQVARGREEEKKRVRQVRGRGR
jgi:hypothetical protein